MGIEPAVARPGAIGAEPVPALLRRGLLRVRAAASDPVVVRSVVIVAALRLTLGLAGWLAELASSTAPAGTVLPQLLVPHGGLRWAVLGPWPRDDGLWYQLIATRGFTHGGPDDGFFPLYPGLVHAAGTLLGGDELLAALLVSTLMLVAGLILLQRLAGLDLDELGARRTVLYLVLSPTAFFLLAPFTEATFLALSAGCLLAARRGRFGLAAACVALAALCRVQGILLAAPLLVEVLAARRGRLDRRLAWLALPGAAMLGYIVAFTQYSGFRFGPFGANTQYWHLTTVAPWRALADSVAAIPAHSEEVFNLLSVLILLACLPALWRLRPAYAVYAAVSAAPILVHEAQFTPLMSASRYVALVIPLFVLLAQAAGRHPRLHRLVSVGFPALMLARFIGYVQFHFVA